MHFKIWVESCAHYRFVRYKFNATCALGKSDYDVPDNHVNKDGFVIGNKGDSGGNVMPLLV